MKQDQQPSLFEKLMPVRMALEASWRRRNAVMYGELVHFVRRVQTPTGSFVGWILPNGKGKTKDNHPCGRYLVMTLKEEGLILFGIGFGEDFCEDFSVHGRCYSRSALEVAAHEAYTYLVEGMLPTNIEDGNSLT